MYTLNYFPTELVKIHIHSLMRTKPTDQTGLCHPGPEITDELLKVLRKRLDETTLDIITVMLVRNCKLTPADVEVRAMLELTEFTDPTLSLSTV